MIYDAIVSLVGTVPAGMEKFIYVVSCVVLLFLLCGTFTFLGSLFKRLNE